MASENSSRSTGYLFLGILLIILGILALGYTLFTGLFTLVFLGWLLLIGGIVQFFAAFFQQHVVRNIFLGLLYGLIGILIVVNPATSLATITLALGILLTFGGLIRVVASMFRFNREAHAGLNIFSGLVSFILGILIWANWPESSIYTFGIFIGIDLVLAGIAWTVQSFEIKRLHSA